MGAKRNLFPEAFQNARTRANYSIFFRCQRSVCFLGSLWATANPKDGLSLKDETLERGCYALRAMISQMTNHKRKTRTVPEKYVKTFRPILGIIVLSGNGPEKRDGTDEEDEEEGREEADEADKEPEDDDEEAETSGAEQSDDCMVVEPDSDVDIVSVCSSKDLDVADLFSSADPDLQALLREGRPQNRRLPQKTTPRKPLRRSAASRPTTT